MTDDDRPDPVDLREEAMMHLAKNNYAVSYHPRAGRGEFTVHVRPGQKAGGQLHAILNYFGYAPVYPSETDCDEFVFKVKCQPANWQNWDEPSYQFIDEQLPYDIEEE